MANATSEVASIETDRGAKERDFYKYYQSRSYGLEFQPLESGPRSSPDKALTAFCQLGALRLNARRSQISFFDRKNQYILAEATRSSSLQDGQSESQNDRIWSGITCIHREDSICARTIELTPVLENDIDMTVLIINDLAKDEGIQKRKHASVGEEARFYASVPITSPEGHAIGAYCIVSDEPREGLKPAELSFMKDMATIIMVHLERTRASEASLRSERMLRGLGSFVDGNYAVQDWWMQPSFAKATQGETLQEAEEWSDKQFAAQKYSNFGHNTQDNGEATQLDSSSTRKAILMEDENEVRMSDSYSDGEVKPLQADPNVCKQTANRQQDVVQEDVKTTFSRAANLIRVVTDVDEAIFFDASVGTFGGLVDRQHGQENSLTELDDSDSHDSEDDSSGDDGHNSPTTNKSSDKPCEVLGFAAIDRCSADGYIPVGTTGKMTEEFLRALLHKYTTGKIFTFDSTSSSDKVALPHSIPGFDQRRDEKLERSYRSECVQLLKVFPGVRSLAIVPLFDSTRKNWFAGGIIWTSDPMRILTTELELNYLAAFGNSIMAEVHSLNAKRADSAKSKFISSVSHELRSPLHGILGSIECLQDTELDAFQDNLVHTVETCGKTLLDTIDHLLDYAKINNFMQKPQNDSEGGNRSRRSRPHRSQVENKINRFALDADVDLSVIMEEVTETVFAGHDFTRLGGAAYMRSSGASASASTDTRKEQAKHDRDEGNESSLKHVLAIVDIDKASDSHWIFRTQAGAWRRIIMNLFGNALKYTEKGFIHVRLYAQPRPLKGQAGRSRVTLVVTDSGRGMSEEYLREQLFTPFAQENSLAPGTGLGLSIVKQIVESMGGDIDVQSKKDHGTQITINVTMLHVPMDDNVLEQSVIASTSRKAQGLKIGFIGFKANSFAASPEDSFRDPANYHHHFMTSFHKLCKNWFGMEMHVVSDLDREDIDIYLTTEDGADEVEERLAQKVSQGAARSRQNTLAATPLLVLCMAASRAQQRMQVKQQSGSDISEYISQPCGPRKLAKALSLCIDRLAASTDPSKPQSGSQSAMEGREKEKPNSEAKDPSQPNENRPDDISWEDRVGSTSKGDQADTDGRGQGSDAEDDKRLPSRTKETPPQGAESSTSLTPRTPIHKKQAVTRTTKPEVSPAPQQTVLLVDDNPINLQLLVNYMKKNKHTFATATNGLEAYDAYKAMTMEGNDPQSSALQLEGPNSNPPSSPSGQLSSDSAGRMSISNRFDYVLMDVSMPVMDGLESTRKIRAHEHQHDLKPTIVIALTGLNSVSAQQEAYSSGVDLFMTKPVSLKILTKVFKTRAQSGGEQTGRKADDGASAITDDGANDSLTNSASDSSKL